MRGVEKSKAYLPEELRSFADLYEYYRSLHAQDLAVIWHKLKEAGIEIPFPQQDIHIKSEHLPRVEPTPENKTP